MLAITRQDAAVTISARGALAASASPQLRARRALALLFGALLAALATLAVVTLPGATEPHAHAVASPGSLASRPATRLPVDLAASASASIGASERSFWPVRQGRQLRAQGGGIESTFSASGAVLRVGTGSVGLSLVGVGRGGRVERVGTAQPTATANQVDYRYGPTSELFRNGPYGLEQAFTLLKRPQAGAGSLVLTLGVRGSLSAHQSGSQILFSGAGREALLRYGGLNAWDASGRRLASAMSVSGGRLQIVVNDKQARYPLRIDPIFQQGPKLTGAGEVGRGLFGYRVAVSGDGNTALIGGSSDSGGSGAVWVFTRSEGSWTQQGAKLTGGEESGKSRFGSSVALSANGNTALVGGYEDGSGVGAAWVFTRSEGSWTQQGPKLTGGSEVGQGHFGFSAALSSDGNTALIGGGGDNGEVGAAWVFTRSEGSWTQQGAKLKGAGEEGKGHFGFSVALSGNGNTALLGGVGDGSEVGAAWVFTRSEGSWEQQGGKLTGGSEVGKGEFGEGVALSGEGNTALIGGGGDNGEVGAAWVFTRSEGSWAQQGAKLTGGGEVGKGHFGFSVALSGEGDTALIGGGGDNNEVGAAWFFARSGETWEQQGAKLTGTGEVGKGHFGFSAALSADGVTGVLGGLADNSEVGAAWVFVNSPPTAPTVVTGSASSVTSTSATLNATVNPNDETVSDCHFEYGPTIPYEFSVPCATLPGSGSSPVPVSAAVTGLTENATYHFRIVATNALGTSEGHDQTFATAAPPEFGRCVKVAKSVTGNFATATCTSAATPLKHGFEWEPGPPPKSKFTTKNKPATAINLTTTGKQEIVCTEQSGTGDYTGTKTVGSVVMTFAGCEMEGSKCASAGAEEGDLTTNPLEGTLGVEKTSSEGPTKNKIALDLFPAGDTGPVMEFTCGLTAVIVRGSVLAPVKSNSMLLSMTVKYVAKTGKQKPEKFEGQLADVLETAFVERGFIQTGLTLTTVQTNEEKIEINPVV